MKLLLAIHGAAFLLVVLDAVVRGVRIRLLLPRSRRPGLWRAIVVNAYGDAASAVTPARLGGEPARFVGLGPGGAAAAALAVELVVDWALIALATVGLLGVFGIPAAGRLMRADLLPWLGAVAALAALSVGAARWYRRRRPQAGGAHLRDGIAALRALRPRTLGAVALLTAVSMAARVAILPLLVVPHAAAPDVGAVTLGSFGLLFSQLVLPMPAGAGGVELAFVAGFAGMLPAAEIASLLIAWRIYTLILPAAFGFLAFARGRRVRRLLARVGAVGASLAALSVAGSVAAAQSRGSRDLSVDHWGYEQIERLRVRGYLAGLNPLVQPYRRLDVAREVRLLDPDTLPEPAGSWVRLLRAELGYELARLDGDDAAAWGITAMGGARASSSQRLDPLRPLGEEDVWPLARGGVWVETGPFAGEMRLLADLFREDDPDGVNPGQRRGGRSDNAYVALAVPVLEVRVGRFARNWAVLGTRGMMISPEAAPYPQLGLHAAIGPVGIRAFSGELETLDGRKRFLSGHRIDYRRENLVVSFGESVLYAVERGGVQLRFLNPVEFLFFDVDNAPNDATQNLMLDGQLWIRRGPVVFFGEFLLDDIDVAPSGPDAEPLLYAFTAQLRVPQLAPRLEAGLQYEQVSAWAYRTPKVVDWYSFLQRGLGANFSDFDRLTAWLDLYPPITGLRLSPTLYVQRQGEGDFRDSIPPTAEYLASPTLFLGQKETTVRPALRGYYQPTRWFWIRFDVGANVIRDRGHVAGVDETTLEGVLEAGARIESPLGRLR